MHIFEDVCRDVFRQIDQKGSGQKNGGDTDNKIRIRREIKQQTGEIQM